MKTTCRLILIGILLSVPNLRAQSRMDTGQHIFFPTALGQKITAYASFPLTWWNFLVFDTNESPEDLAQLRTVCQELKKVPSVAVVECGVDLAPYLNLARDWSRDWLLRVDKPNDSDLDRALALALAQASLPMGRELLEMFREDPVQNYRELQNRLKQKAVLKGLTKKNGVFYDSESKRYVVPIKFAHPPAEAALSEVFAEKLKSLCKPYGNCDRWIFFGTHAATLENREQIHKDLSVASWFGTLGMLGFFLLLIFLRRWQFVWMIPVIMISVVVGGWVTVLIYGSIHGLTLSFGMGIVGLSLDYALHSALNTGSKQAWKSNIAGLLTTIGVLAVMAFSSVPLLQQLMVFSGIGLCLSFALLWILDKKVHSWFAMKPFAFEPRSSHWRTGIALFLLVGGLLQTVFFKPEMSIERFNYQGAKTREIGAWFIKQSDMTFPLFEVRPATERAHQAMDGEQKWATTANVSLENAAAYLPLPEIQKAHLASWLADCSANGKSPAPVEKWVGGLPAREKLFFAPFLAKLDCDKTTVRNLADLNPPAYLVDTVAKGNALSLWLPKSTQESARIKKEYPNATSLRELVSFFPETLTREFKWMAPISIFLVGLIVYLYYRSLVLTVISLIPFFCGVGGSYWVGRLDKTPFTFVSWVGLIMLCGLSVDYSIFAIDLSRNTDLVKRGTWTSLLLSSVTAICGFIPLVFCKHQVLTQLGHVLTFGTLGTLVGSFWGVPPAMKWWNRRK